MAYNRTDQEKGRATKYLPASEWIVSVGKHPGLIPGKVWVQIQESLERNKSKSFRKPRSNEALLTGLLFCSCGERMYPKMSKRKTADGKVIYTYVCKMKERSQRSVCNSKNANGNTLDMAVVERQQLTEQIKFKITKSVLGSQTIQFLNTLFKGLVFLVQLFNSFGHVCFGRAVATVASGNTEDDDDDVEDDRLGKTEPLSASKTHWGEDSK